MKHDLLDIYNSFIKAYRTANSAPFRYRKTYETLPQEVKNKVERIKLFFDSYEINVDDFFEAPYFLYNDTKYFAFDYYLSRKAVKSYSDFEKEILMMGPDHIRNLVKIKNSALFLKKFLKTEGICFAEYLNNKKEKVPSFVTHLKNRNVSIYFLMGLEGFEKAFFAFDSNLLKFIIPDIYENYELYNKKFLTSQNARILVKSILNKKILS